MICNDRQRLQWKGTHVFPGVPKAGLLSHLTGHTEQPPRRLGTLKSNAAPQGSAVFLAPAASCISRAWCTCSPPENFDSRGAPPDRAPPQGKDTPSGTARQARPWATAVPGGRLPPAAPAPAHAAQPLTPQPAALLRPRRPPPNPPRTPFGRRPHMLSATRSARQLLHSLLPVARMGESASKLVSPQEALPGRKEPTLVAAKHHVNGNRTVEPFPEGTQMAVFGMGCFWGAERKFWILKGVYSTQVGFAGGYTSNPTYKEVCSGAYVVMGMQD
nr:mitochondrial peptide methionine sulfoxide reductase isoform X6 [Microcebus murinus]